MKGYVQVYTGDGKGKTTAALGLALRAVGANKKVLLLQFMKSKAYAEHKVLPHIPGIEVITVGKPCFIIPEGMKDQAELERWGDEVVVFPKGQPPKDYVDLVAKGQRKALEALQSGDYDVVILDEYNMALFFDLLKESDARALLQARKDSVELVMTGRGAPQYLMDAADLVTTMTCTKHYYDQGVDARLGIEH